MFKSIKNFIINSFRKPVQEPEVLTPESIVEYVRTASKSVYPVMTDSSQPIFSYAFSTIFTNEIEYSARGYSLDLVKPSFNEVTEVLAVQMELAVEFASATESLSYILGAQPVSGPAGLIYYLASSEGKAGISIQSDAIHATVGSVTTIDQVDTLVELTPATLSTGMHSPSTENLEAIKASTKKFGLDVTRDVINELASHVPTAKSISLASESIRKDSRRGYANFILVNDKSLELLNSHYKVASAGRSQHGTPYIQEVGMITVADNTISVLLVDNPSLDDKVLIGYKGVSSQTDAGLFFSPYVSTGTRTVSSSIAARYGLKFQENGKNYYRTVPLKAKKPRAKKVKESPVVESP